MGLFDFFKKKKQDNFLANLPPAMRQAFAVLFPNGNADHDRQLDELCKHFGNKYKREDIDSNLIFILTGYLITGDSKTKESCIDKVMNRKVHTMSREDVEYLYTYALTNHPKLAPILALTSIMDDMSEDGCDTDTIPGGQGMFGYDPDNPIPTHGVTGSYEYLDHLRDVKGYPVKYKRLGTTESLLFNHPLDAYELTSPGIYLPLVIYISAYQKRNSQLSPSDLILVDSNNIVISSGGTAFGIGQKCEPDRPQPRLWGMTSFKCFQGKDLEGKSEEFCNAERLNKEGFLLANNDQPVAAISKLKLAVQCGSKNAANNLFVVYHDNKLFKEGLQHLVSVCRSQNPTAGCLYNLALILSGLHNDYKVKVDMTLAFVLLNRVLALPYDNTEEGIASAKTKARELIDYLSVDNLP